MDQIEALPLADYYLAIEAYSIKRVLQREDLALQAWYGQTVQATTGSSKHPKPKYKKFEQFYDTEEYEDEIRSSFEDDYTSELTVAREQENAMQERFKKLQEMKEKDPNLVKKINQKGGHATWRATQ